MDRWPMITDALMERHHEAEMKGQYHPLLSELLLELAEMGRLTEEDAADVKAFTEEQKKVRSTALHREETD
jgi:hypothetical protein